MKIKAIVKDNPDNVVPREVFADAIVKISEGMKRLIDSGLNERAIVVLIHDHCLVGKPDIRAVLSSLRELADQYTTKRK